MHVSPPLQNIFYQIEFAHTHTSRCDENVASFCSIFHRPLKVLAAVYNLTQIYSPYLLEIKGSGAEIPPFETDPPDDLADANRYWERREGMHAQVPAGSIVLNGRNVFGGSLDSEVWVARADSTIGQRLEDYTRRSFRDAHEGVARVIRELQRGGTARDAAKARAKLQAIEAEAREAQEEAGLDTRPSESLNAIDWSAAKPGDPVEIEGGGKGRKVWCARCEDSFVVRGTLESVMEALPAHFEDVHGETGELENWTP